MRAGLLAAAWTFAAASAASAEQARWTLELLSGSAANAKTSLTVRQEGEPTLEISARWATRPFRQPLYWAVRLGRSSPRGGWELELMHHKIYLENTTAEVSRFEITHGFNMATLQRTWIRSDWIFRVGAGAVVTHTESRVRGLSGGGEGDEAGGYELAGPAFQVGVGRRFALTRHLFGTLEGKATYGRASVSIARGTAKTSNVAFHGLFGLGGAFP